MATGNSKSVNCETQNCENKNDVPLLPMGTDNNRSIIGRDGTFYQRAPVQAVTETENKGEDRHIKTVKKWLVLALSIMMFGILLLQTFRQAQTATPSTQSEHLSKLISNLLSILNGGVPNVGASHAIGAPIHTEQLIQNETFA